MKSFKYTVNGNVYKVVINRVEDTIAEVIVNGTSYNVELNKPAKKQSAAVKRPAPASVPPIARPTVALSPGELRSPLPGTILEIACKEGDTIKKGQKLIILEAMKMENSIIATRDGVVKEIKVKQGESVLEGAELIVID